MRGDRLALIRKQRGYSQEDLSQATGIGVKMVGRYERGEVDPSGESLAKIASLLEVSADYLLGLVEEPEQRLTEEMLSPMERKLITAVRSGLLADAIEAALNLSKESNRGEASRN